MKRLCVFAVAVFFLSAAPLPAVEALAPQNSTMTAVSSATLAAEPFSWPVSNTIKGRTIKIVSNFGKRKAPPVPAIATTTVVMPAEELHEGVDFGVPADSPVRAARSGKVLFAGFSTAYVTRKDKKEKNHLVIVRHADGKSTRYVHLDRLLVRPGQLVAAGDVLGQSSLSDEWYQPVVHFEIRESNGQAVDPVKYFSEMTQPPAL